MNTFFQKIRISQIIFFILTAAVMIVIFILSSESAVDSSETSASFIKAVIGFFYRGYHELPLERQDEICESLTFAVRKLAHFSIYASLGFCASFTVGRRRLFSRKSLGVLIFSFLYAFSDEIHQKFSDGRSCELRDMLIDTCGALTGMLISLALMGAAAYLRQKRTRHC